MGTSAPATPTSTLICLEDGNDLFLDGDDDDSPSGAAVADFRLAADDHLLLLGRDDDEYVALMLSKEVGLGDGGECGGAPLAEEVDGWTRAARALCVDWIVKTNARFRFSGKTAYVAVTYLDRFLARRRVDRGQEWALQLLSVACLSLAAKVEEHRVPRLPEFRPDQYDFDCASILRMELLVLTTLQWQMIAPTPFPYLGCFAARLRHDERRAVVLRAVNCIFASIKAMSSVEYRPSTIALASILVARGDNREEGTLTFPKLAEELKAILGSSWQQLHTGHVYSCYSVMIQEDRSIGRRQQSSRELASSGVSIAAHVGSSDDATSMAAASDNNAAATTSAAAAAAITDGNNKRKRLHSPQLH